MAKKVHSFEDIIQRQEDRNLYIDLLIDHGTADSLKAAVKAIMEDHLDGQHANLAEDQHVSLQARKLLAIEKLATFVDAQVQQDPQITMWLQSFAQVDGFANVETTNAVIIALVGKRNKEAFGALQEILCFETETGITISATKKLALIKFTARPEKAGFVLDNVMALDTPDQIIYTAVKDIANEAGGALTPQAYQYLRQDGSDEAMTQVRYLKGSIGTVEEFKKLPRSEAVIGLKQAFAHHAYGALHALIDLRQDALATGQNDVAEYEAAISEGVRQLAEKDSTLLSLIKKGEDEQLKTLFGRLADVGFKDLRPKYDAAVKVIVREDALHSAQRDMGRFSEIDFTFQQS